jgi:lysophospholipase L1-like esterase
MRLAWTRRRKLSAGLAAGLALAIVAGLAFTVGPLAGSPQTAATTPTASPTATASPSPTPSPSPTASPTPAPPALPTMLASIGDSYAQGYDPSLLFPRFHDHPQYSFVVGWARNDSIFSLRERFEALGDTNLKVVDAAETGKKMDRADDQARQVVAAAKTLPPGSTVYVTFELGTNDLCSQPETPVTSPTTFERELRAGIKVLTDSLPAGSRILMLSVPDFVHFRAITQADPTARAHFAEASNENRCPPFLGSHSSISLARATQILHQYDSILFGVCDEVEAGGKIHCTRDGDGQSEWAWTIDDLSPRDYFHPSISGQAKMADVAWANGDWSQIPLPADAAQ